MACNDIVLQSGSAQSTGKAEASKAYDQNRPLDLLGTKERKPKRETVVRRCKVITDELHLPHVLDQH